MKGRVKLALAIVLSALVAAGGTWWAMRAGAAQAPPPPPAPVDVSLEPFTTNLRDGRVIQVTVVLRVEGEKAREELESTRIADVRHAIHRVLRGLTAADVAGAGGMDRLRQALLEELQGSERLREIPVREVLLTDLIVQ